MVARVTEAAKSPKASAAAQTGTLELKPGSPGPSPPPSLPPLCFSWEQNTYGGINTVGNPGQTLEGADNQLRLNLPSGAVLAFQKQ
jgi:hypothetical protein